MDGEMTGPLKFEGRVVGAVVYHGDGTVTLTVNPGEDITGINRHTMTDISIGLYGEEKDER